MHHLRLPICTILFALLGGLVHAASAHDPGLSIAGLSLADHEIAVHLTFARREIESLVRMDTDATDSVSATELVAVRPRLRMLGRDAVALSVDGQPLVAQVATVELDKSDALHMRLNFPRPPGARLRVSMPIIAQLARGHRQYIAVQDAKGNPIATHILDAAHAGFALALSHTVTAAPESPAWRHFLRLGVEHIVAGYDHLLFLFGLLVVSSSFASAWRIITSFTVAHSITLALATLNVVQLPPRLVEPLIAASIVYVGLENLWHRHFHRRWLLTFGFGLVHGLGFASVLRELSLGTKVEGEVVMPLLAFNVGVELGQVAIALVVLPFIWYVQRLPHFSPRFATICSALVVLAGAYWLVERTVLN